MIIIIVRLKVRLLQLSAQYENTPTLSHGQLRHTHGCAAGYQF